MIIYTICCVSFGTCFGLLIACILFANRGEKTLEAVTAQRDYLLATMRKLACLGNGDKYGNSIGNEIAQKAIAKCEAQNGN